MNTIERNARKKAYGEQRNAEKDERRIWKRRDQLEERMWTWDGIWKETKSERMRR